MVAPLMAGKVVKGVMAVWRTGGEPFGDSDLEFLVGPVAAGDGRDRECPPLRRVAAARRRARDDQQGVAAARQQARARRAARARRRADSQGVQGRPRLRRACYDPGSGMIHFPYQYGESDYKPLKLGEGLTSKIIASRKPLIINNEADRQSHDLGAKVVGRRALSYLGVPISVGDTCLGVISVQSTQTEGALRRRRRAAAVDDRRERRRRACRTCGCSTRPRKRWSSRPPPPRCCR